MIMSVKRTCICAQNSAFMCVQEKHFLHNFLSLISDASICNLLRTRGRKRSYKNAMLAMLFMLIGKRKLP